MPIHNSEKVALTFTPKAPIVRLELEASWVWEARLTSWADTDMLVVVYFDDIMFFTYSKEDHVGHQQNVFLNG